MGITKGKTFTTKNTPADGLATSNLFGRVEPLITPEQLISKYLKGIPNLDIYTSDDLKSEIELSINEIESESNLTIFKTQFRQSLPYDPALYRSFLYAKVNHRPVLSVEKMGVVTTNGVNLLNLPLDYISPSLFHKGQINLITTLALLGNLSTTANSAPSGALIFLNVLSTSLHIPSFWEIDYTAGVCSKEGLMPIEINNLIGINTAINILSSLSALYLNSSQSLSQDSLSQSSSGLASNTFTVRIQHLEARKAKAMAQLKRIFHEKFYISNI